MSALNEALNQVKDQAIQDSKAEFLALITEAKNSTEPFVRENAARIEQWVVQLNDHQIDQEEFDDLMADQKLAAEQFANTQAIATQARAQRLTLKILDLAITKIVPALLVL